MFIEGLPVRGVINYGKYFLRENCFAGKSIVEAYQLCKKIDLSACVLTEKASDEIHKFDKEILDGGAEPLQGVFLLEYLIPMTDGEIHLDALMSDAWVINENDISSCVMNSFWNHNKDISVSVRNKVINTEQWLTFLKMKIIEFENKKNLNQNVKLPLKSRNNKNTNENSEEKQNEKHSNKTT
jgi:hypothetical protein